MVQEEECGCCWKVQAGEEQEVSVYFSHFLSEALRVQRVCCVCVCAFVRAPLTVKDINMQILAFASPFYTTYLSMWWSDSHSLTTLMLKKQLGEIINCFWRLTLLRHRPLLKLQNRPSGPQQGRARHRPPHQAPIIRKYQEWLFSASGCCGHLASLTSSSSFAAAPTPTWKHLSEVQPIVSPY